MIAVLAIVIIHMHFAGIMKILITKERVKLIEKDRVKIERKGYSKN